MIPFVYFGTKHKVLNTPSKVYHSTKPFDSEKRGRNP